MLPGLVNSGLVNSGLVNPRILEMPVPPPHPHQLLGFSLQILLLPDAPWRVKIRFSQSRGDVGEERRKRVTEPAPPG